MRVHECLLLTWGDITAEKNMKLVKNREKTRKS